MNSVLRASTTRYFCTFWAALALCALPLRAEDGNARHASSAAVRPDSATNISSHSVDQAAWSVLLKGLKDGSAANRIAAIDALSTMGGNGEAVHLIESALKDRDDSVRVEAALRLGDMGNPASVPALKEALDDKSPVVAFAAARALAQMGDTEGRDELIEVLTGDRRISGGFFSTGTGFARQQMSDPWSLVTMGASQTASIFGGPFAGVGVAFVHQLLTDNSAPPRAASAQALGEDGSERAVRVLEKALTDHNWTVRAAAAEALGRTSEPHAIPRLEPLLKDNKAPVRYAAAASIVRLNSVLLGLLRW